MQTGILTIAILLAGQVSDPSAGRYGQYDLSNSAPAATTDGSATSPTDTSMPVQQPAATPPAVMSPPAGATAGNPLRNSPPATTPPATVPPANRTATPRTGLTKVVKPVDLLKSLAKPNGQSAIAGTPLSLAEAVQTSPTRAAQAARVKLYWELSQAVTEHNLATLEAIQLQSQRNGLIQASQAWDIALQTAAARKQVTLAAVRAAQLRLQQELGLSADGSLPVPTDLPHCGAYETKHQQIFAGPAPREALQLVELLPLRHAELARQASEASAAVQAYSLVNQQRNPQSDGSELLHAYEQLAAKRQAFVKTAYDYNSNIARYTELAVPQAVGTERLVAMLIQTPAGELSGRRTGGRQTSGIRRASATEDVQPETNVAGAPRTFAGETRSETRRVPSEKQPTEGQQEHSILVPAGQPK